MSTSTHNTADIQQAFMNNITQDDQQNCLATTSNTVTGNIVRIDNSHIKGDFTGVAAVTNTDASCLMVSNMEDTISNILSATITQTNSTSTDWFNGFQFTSDTNTFDLSQSVVNNISQINQQTCSANTTTSTSNNYVYVTNTTVGGDFIGVTSTANASASCSMNNTMKTTTYNQAQATVNQSNTVKGMFATILGAFVLIVGIIVIGVIVIFAFGAIAQVGYHSMSQSTPSYAPPPPYAPPPGSFAPPPGSFAPPPGSFASPPSSFAPPPSAPRPAVVASS